MTSNLIFGLALLLAPALAVAEAPSANPSWAEFQKYCHEHRQGAAAVYVRPPVDGKVSFVPVQALMANQGVFSWTSFLNRFKKSLENEPQTAALLQSQGTWTFPNDEAHDFGRSFFPLKKKLRGVYYHGKVYITDGHHRALISTYLGAQTIPVEMVDLSWVPADQFETYLKKQGYSYLQDEFGQPIVRVDLCDLKDDPNLELVRVLFARIDASSKKGQLIFEVSIAEDGQLVFAKIRGAEWVLGVKTDEEVEFLELMLANALRRKGQVYNGKTPPTVEEIKAFLKIFKAETKIEPRLQDVLLFKKPTRTDRILPVSGSKILRHLTNLSCEAAISPHPTRAQL